MKQLLAITLHICQYVYTVPQANADADNNDVTFVFTASNACKCIDPWNDLNLNITIQQGNCDDGYFQMYEMSAGFWNCLPIGFGSGNCDTWDNGVLDNYYSPMCKVDGAVGSVQHQDWCDSRWCYVDTSTCERHPAGTTFAASPDADEPYPFSYSYETCGNRDEYSYLLYLRSLMTRRWRVTYPGDSQDGMSLVNIRNEEGHLVDRTGITVEMFNRILDDYGLTYDVIEISNKSKEVLPIADSYDRCIYDVALNETDVCIGPFIITADRLTYASFSIPYASDSLYLLTMREQKSTLLEYFLTPLKPFTGEVWGYIWLATIYMAGAMLFVQQKYSRIKIKDKFSKRGLSLCYGWISNNLYYGSKSITSGGVVNESEEPGSAEKVIIVGFNLFALIILTAYTATSTAALVLTEQSVEYNTLKEAIDSKEVICFTNVYKGTLLGLYPGLEGLYKILNFESELLESTGPGLDKPCGVAVISKSAYDKELSSFDIKSSIHCDKALTELLFSVSIAFPVQDELSRAVSFAISELASAGAIMNITNNYSDLFIGEPSCTADAVVSKTSSYSGVQIGLRELLSPILISLSCTTAGLLIFIRKEKKRKTNNKSLAPSTDNCDKNLGDDPSEPISLSQLKALEELSNTVSSLLKKDI